VKLHAKTPLTDVREAAHVAKDRGICGATAWQPAIGRS
jgi:hypothetical protein